MKVWDAAGRLIGSITKSGLRDDVNTYDGNNQPLGKVRETGTYFANGTKLSGQKAPGVTLERRKGKEE